jgi:hypothetical protein
VSPFRHPSPKTPPPSLPLLNLLKLSIPLSSMQIHVFLMRTFHLAPFGKFLTQTMTASYVLFQPH